MTTAILLVCQKLDDEKIAIKIVNFLLEYEAIPDEEMMDISIEKGWLDMVKMLTEKKLFEERPSSYDLIEACRNKDAPMVKYLVEIGVEVNSYCDDWPIKIACNTRNREIIRILSEAGADFNVSGDDGYTPIYEAYLNATNDFLLFLVKMGASLLDGTSDRSDHSMLHYLVKYDKWEALEDIVWKMDKCRRKKKQ